jgi:hypothetical protein
VGSLVQACAIIVTILPGALLGDPFANRFLKYSPKTQTRHNFPRVRHCLNIGTYPQERASRAETNFRDPLTNNFP